MNNCEALDQCKTTMCTTFGQLLTTQSVCSLHPSVEFDDGKHDNGARNFRRRRQQSAHNKCKNCSENNTRTLAKAPARTTPKAAATTGVESSEDNEPETADEEQTTAQPPLKTAKVDC